MISCSPPLLFKQALEQLDVGIDHRRDERHRAAGLPVVVQAPGALVLVDRRDGRRVLREQPMQDRGGPDLGVRHVVQHPPGRPAAVWLSHAQFLRV
jgi:hypothetical protein